MSTNSLNDTKHRSSQKNRAKYRIKGKIGSFLGFAIESAKPGDKVSVVTQFSYFNHPDTSNELAMISKCQIDKLLAERIFPIIL